MNSAALSGDELSHPYPVDVHVEPVTENRNRLTTAFRFFLAFPHLLLVGGPIAAGLTWTWSSDGPFDWGVGGGVLGAVAGICALIAWFAIVFTGRYPDGLWSLAAFYLRWRVRVVSYVALLRDDYPPFGDAPYPATLALASPEGERDRLTVAFRLILALPHIIAVWALGIAWCLATIVAWFSILFTGRYPPALYEFALGVMRWNVRVEAYVLLLTDEYPPFALQ